MSSISMVQLEFNLLIDSPYHRKVNAHLLKKVVSETLEHAGVSQPTEVSLVITDDDTISRLNEEYRGAKGTTDVLSFSLNGPGSFVLPPDDLNTLGEVVISYPQASRQADEQGHQVDEEMALLTTHGLLHLMGYDHESEEEEEEMRRQEQQSLARVGIDLAYLGRI